jgi:shikimate kinase / 3-dehydroquinate synthase
MKPIVLSGFMGAGKSTVGPIVAGELGVPFVDTDAEIEREAGARIPELWRRDGERGFRSLEQGVIARLLSDPSPKVIAFGGGAVTHRPTRHLALDRATVVTLHAAPSVLQSRLGDAADRPNLAPATADGRLARIAELLDARADAYAEAHGTLSTDDREPRALAREIVAIAERDPLVMPLGRRSYTVDVVSGGAGSARVAAILARAEPTSLVVVTDENVRKARGGAIDEALNTARVPVTWSTLEPGEAHKTVASIGAIWDAALGAKVDRRALVVAFGGGVVGDLAGFAASTLLRGLRLVHVPTTLLAMVDSSIGGKTGFDHSLGKNLLGTFHQPEAVVVDTDHLSTLPARELVAGFAEIIKVAIVADGELFARLEAIAATSKHPRLPQGEELMAVIRSAIAAKIRVVRDDEREGGTRALLNLGHTVGHGLEAVGAYRRYLHGEAVAIGTLAELAWGVSLGHTPPDLVARVHRVFSAAGLPTEASREDMVASRAYFTTDKKRDGQALNVPFVRSPGEASVERVPLDALPLRSDVG